MRIGLLDADLMDHGTRHPNLALMKLSGYYKELDNDVDLIYKSYDEVNDFDEIFISKVFTFSNIPEWVIEKDNVHIGGTGFFEDGGENLPEEIEHHSSECLQEETGPDCICGLCGLLHRICYQGLF